MTTEYLLIGAGGLVGGAIREALAGRRHVATSHRAPVPGTLSLDITDDAAVRRLVRDAHPRTVILAAAEPWVERCEREPALTRAVNVAPGSTLAEEVRAIDARLVVFSSEYVFGGTRNPYAEEDPTAPINEYGRQKVELERAAASAGKHLICRTSGVFGWEAARKNFVCALVDRLRGGVPFDVPSDQLITPTYAPALARAVLELCDRGTQGVVHTCGPAIVNRLDFARTIAGVFALPAELLRGRTTESLGSSAPRPLAAGLSDARLRGTLGHGLPDPVAALAEMRDTEVRRE